MTLDEYTSASAEDDNLFWRLDSGDIQNLLEEAMERLDLETKAHRIDCERFESRIAELRAERDNWKYRAETATEGLRNVEAALGSLARM